MNNQEKSAISRWSVPTLVLVLALVAMFFNFSSKSEVEARDSVNKSTIMMAERSASKVKEEILSLVKVGEPIADILGDMGEIDIEYAAQLLEIAMKYSGAYKIYVCDESGKGIDNEGHKIELAEEEYFAAASGSDDIRYIYTLDNGSEEVKGLLVTIPVAGEEEKLGYILMFYNIDNFARVVKNVDFATWNFASLVDRKGTIIAVTGKGTQWKANDNMYTELQANNSDVVNSIRGRINTNTSGIAYVDMYGLSNALVYVPIGMGDLVLVAGISQTYIDARVTAQLSNFKGMIIQLIAVVCIFIVIVVIISIMSKLINSKKQKQLEEKADTDLLTGLSNKLATERKIKEYIAKNPESQAMMFILDIDNFKKINDTMGHAFGDEVLRSLGEQIRVIFRSSDIVGRAGGDEFIVFLKNITEPAAIRKEAKKVENFFKNFKAGEYTKYAATASIGVAIYPEEGADFESIYKAADSALYKAKKGGKNQLAFYKDKWLVEEQTDKEQNGKEQA